MTRLPRPLRRLAAVLLWLPLSAPAAPVAVNDQYQVNEDANFSTAGAALFASGFESSGDVLTGPWQFLDKIKNEQNGQTADPYPVDGASRNWKDLDFDTATSTVAPWGTGVMPLQGGTITGFPGAPDVLTGYGSGGNYTVTTYLFRKVITLDAVTAGVTQWSLRHLVDDAAIFYINGQEVHRVNFAAGQYTPAGEVTTITYANTSLQDETVYTTSSLTIPAGLLKAGSNIVAVELHQGGVRTSTDAGIDCQLTPVLPPAGGFVYADDTLGTSQPGAAAGSVDAAAGNPGPALLVELGRVNASGLSGGWQRTFELSAPAMVRVGFDWKAATRGGVESGEFCGAVLMVDGVRYGSAGTAPALFAGTLSGQGDGNPDLTTGWTRGSVEVPLPAGTHTLMLGGFCSRTAAVEEYSQVWFDNVSVETVSGGSSLLANDTGGASSVQLVSGVSHGELRLAADGHFSYVPAPNYAGTDQFTYRALDAASAASEPAIVEITVHPVNDAPVAVADSYTAWEQEPLSIPAASGVLANDSDIDSPAAALSAVTVTPPSASQGTLTLEASGAFLFTPAAAFLGTASFSYRVSDGVAESAPVTVSILVRRQGNAPVAVDDAYSLNEDGSLGTAGAAVLAADFEPGVNIMSGPWSFLDKIKNAQNGQTANTYPVDAASRNWKALDFDTATSSVAPWGTGALPLQGGGITALPGAPNLLTGYGNGGNYSITTYLFRKVVSLDAATAAVTQWSLRHLIDDAAIFYINGQEVHRVNFAPGQYTPAGDITTNTYANNSLPDETVYTTSAITIPAGLLVPGNNILAIELHQGGSLSSTDIGIDCQLTPAGLAGGGFTYVDDPFGTSRPNNASGSLAATGGNPGGALLVDLGRVNATGFSGGWQQTFVLGAPGTVRFSLDWAIGTRGGLEPDEYSEAVLMLDGVRYGPGGSAPSLVLGRLTGVGNGSTDLNTPWTRYTMDLPLAAGPHTLTLGGFVNKTTLADEYGLVWFDNVSVSSVSGGNGVLSNDSGGPVRARLVDTVAHGTLTFLADGNFSYIPARDYAGTDHFTYVAADAENVESNVAGVTLTIDPVNDLPVAVADTYSTSQQQALTVSAAAGVLANDTDADHPGSALRAEVVTIPVPSAGDLTLQSDGAFVFTPAPGFTGPATFVYRVSDGAGFSSAATVTVNVISVGNAPVAAPDTYTTAVNAPLTVNALSSATVTEDVVPYGSSAVSSVWKFLDNGSDQGVLWRDPDFDDAAWKSGGAELGYGNGDEVTVVEDNPAPGYTTGVSDRFATTYFRRSFTVQRLYEVTAVDGALIYDDGAVIYLDGAEIYRTGTMSGAGADPLFSYYCTASGNNAAAAFTLAPSALSEGLNSLAAEVHQTTATSSDVSFNLRLRLTRQIPGGLLANDTDMDPGAVLTILSHTEPAHGVLSLNPNGTFTYTPAVGYTGPDAFTYTCTDGTLASSTATVSLTVVPGPNVRPVAVADTYAAGEDTVLHVSAANGVLANDTDADGDALHAVLVKGPASGSLTLNAGGDFTYTPAADFSGVVTFTYTAADAGGASAVTTVTITVNNVNDAPVAVADIYSTDPGAALVEPAPGVLGNDTDADAGTVLTAELVAGPAEGALTLLPDGSFNYAPPAGFTGNVTFTYRAGDGLAFSAPVTVTVRLNGRPVASGDTFTATEDTPLSIAAPGLLANDTDAENDPLTARLTATAARGTLALSASGAFTYTPQANFHGTDSFTYKAFDGARDSVSSATVTIHVIAVNDAPVAVNDTYATAGDTPLAVSAASGVLHNDSDADGQTLVAEVVTPPAHGFLALNPDGAFTYAPDNGYTGVDVFTYRAGDGEASSAAATVSLNVGVDLKKIYLNEIHYHPQSLSAGDEFIEIFNDNPGAVDVSGWRFSAGIDFVFPAGTLIPARGYAVVAASPAQFTATFGGAGLLLGPWTGELSNSGELVRLKTSAGETVNEVEYADEGDWAERQQVSMGGQTGWEWSSRSDAGGSSLELINPALPNSNGQNWAAAAAGPTPGKVNSRAAADIAPLLSDLDHRPQIPRSTDPVAVTVNVTDEALTPPLVALFWRLSTATPGAFMEIPMQDDGLHGDGRAGDGEFGGVIPPQANGAVVEFYVSATDAGGQNRTWPAAGRNLAGTASIQAANAFYQVDEEVWANHYPIYRLIGPAADVALYLSSWNRSSDAQVNVTLVSKQGASVDVRYRCGLRVRGAGSRGNAVNNWRLNIPKDDKWNNETEANLNVWHTHLGDLGSNLMEMAGLIHERAWPVQVRLNATNRALANSAHSNGYFIHLQPAGGEYLSEMRPNDRQGNLYKKVRPHQDFRVRETSAGGPPSASGYQADGWIKANNEDLNDWSDLHSLMKVFSTASPAVADLEKVIDVDYWMRWLAFQTIINHYETNLSNGANDDFGLYRGVADPRIIPLAHDFDTILGGGGNTSSLDPSSPTATIYQVTGNFGSGETIPALAPLYTNPELNQRYKAQLVELLHTLFLPARFNPLVDSLLGDWTGPAPEYGVSTAKRTALKTFLEQRRNHILQTVLGYSAAGTPPPALTVAAALPVVNGYAQTTGASVSGLSGTVDSTRVRKVRINGTEILPDNFRSSGGGEGASGPATWSAGPAVVLHPGLNQLTVSALGAGDAVIATETIEIWYDNAAVTSVGAVTGNTVWSAAGGPYRVTSSLTLDDETLTIEPGTTVYLGAGVSLNVSGTGRLLAEGTDTAPVRFMREPGQTAPWGNIQCNGSALESRLVRVIIDGSGASPAIQLTSSAGYFDRLRFVGVTTQYFAVQNASFIFQNSIFPATTGVEPVHGSGLPAGGYAVFRGNTFGATTGLNDIIDFTGGQRPGAILQVLDNVFLGGSDDILDLDGTDAHIEGNIFLNVHQQSAGGDMASAISGGLDGVNTSELTVVRNLFSNCDHALIALEGNFYTVVNNTITGINNTGSAAGSTAAAFSFLEPGRAGIGAGLGMFLDGNIVTDCPQVFEHASSATGSITAWRNLFPETPPAPVAGGENLTADPMLTGTTGITAENIRSQLALRPGSPALCSGPNGLDRGGLVPGGSSISGEPVAMDPGGSAVLTAGGPGITHYRYSLDGGAFSAEFPVAVPVTLAGLAEGTHQVRVAGRNSAGVWQTADQAAASRVWTVSAGARPVVISEVLASNVNAYPVAGLRPDLIELRNLSASPVDMGGWAISDRAVTEVTGPRHTFPAGTLIPANGYLLLTTDTLGFNLKASGDAVYLYSGAAAGSPLIDSVTFGFQIADKSISRICDGSRWALSEVTPGEPNRAAVTTSPAGLRLNEWLGSNDLIVADDFLELYNSYVQPVDMSGLILTDDAINFPQQHRIAPLSFIGGNGFVRFIADSNPGAGSDHLAFSISRLREGITLLQGSAVLDAVMAPPQLEDISQGRATDGSEILRFFTLPTPGYSNGTDLTAQQAVLDYIRITELMYNPASGPEYVEIRNLSATQTIDLRGLRLTNGIEFEFTGSSPVNLAPGAFTVITSDSAAAFAAAYPGAPYGGTYSGRLSNGGERLRMEIGGYGLGILDFDYADSWYPQTDGGGGALEIVDASAARAVWSSRTAWRATAPNPGTGGVFAVLAGENQAVALPQTVSLEGVVSPGTQTPAGITLQWSKVSGPGPVVFSDPASAATMAGFVQAGTYVLRLTATGTSAVFGELTVTATESYDYWAVRTFGSADPLITGMSRDPDQDGLSNLLEFSMGLDPASGSSGPGFPRPADGGGPLAMTYQRYAGSGLTYVVEASADLVTWSSTTVTESLTAREGNQETWTAVDGAPASGSSNRFMRLRVIAP